VSLSARRASLKAVAARLYAAWIIQTRGTAMARTRIPLLALALGLVGACGDYNAPSGAQNPPPPAAAANDISIAVGATQLTTTAFSPNPKVVSRAATRASPCAG
jgi:hypothetical protein